MTALAPPPEHADKPYHWLAPPLIDEVPGEPFIMEWWTKHGQWRDYVGGYNPRTAWDAGWRYLKPADPGAIPLPDVETIARALAAKSREIFESKTGRKLLGDDDVEAWNEHARAVLAAISGERK